jgi:hypothetical protein
MKELFDKLSSYNIFNYLLPGAIFSVMLSKMSSFNLVQEDILTGAFFYYFIGLVISRIGSLIIEPLLKKVKFLKFSEYKKYVEVSKTDPKIEILSEANNMFRTFTSLFLLIFLAKLYECTFKKLPIFANNENIIVVLILLFLFLFSYRKQTKFINKRVSS